jgi:hypothetical protein
MLSQLLTLYTTPVIYLFFDAAARRISALRVKRAPVATPTTEAS